MRNILFIIILILVGCSKKNTPNQQANDATRIIESFGSKHSIFLKKDWEIEFIDEGLNQKKIKAFCHDSDTTIEVNLIEFYESKQSTKLIVEEVSISYNNENNFREILRIKEPWDTVYKFSVPSDYFFGYDTPDTTKMNFEKGKYYFLAELGYLDSCQTKYFIKFKDSLVNVKGNNVRELPKCN